MADKIIFDTIEDLKNRKKTPFEVFKNSFIQVDSKTLLARLWKRKIVPGLKDLVLSGISMLFYDNDSYKDSSKFTDGTNHDYTRYSSSKYSFVTDTRKPAETTRSKDIPDYRHLPAVTPEKAETVLTTMREALKKHDYIPVDSFYTMFGYTSTDSNDQEWGWDAKAFAPATTLPAPKGLVYLKIPDAIKVKLR